MSVRIWTVMRAVKKPAYNNQVRVQGLDPSLADSLDVPRWEDAEDPDTNPASWYINSWNTSEDGRDDLVDIATALGPVNIPGPSCQGAYYQDDEPQTGASATAAPIGGWTNEAIDADLFRKPEILKRSPRVGP